MRAKRIASFGILTALALILGYVEMQIPPLFAVPGMKLGLTNLVVLFALYRMGSKDAILINLIRIGISAILFGSGVSFLYSVAGGLLSGLVMILLKKWDRFSAVGVSVAGGLSHNVGQLLVATVLMGTGKIFYYLPVLWLSGTAAGLVIGLLCGLVMKYVPLSLMPAGRG